MLEYLSVFRTIWPLSCYTSMEVFKIIISVLFGAAGVIQLIGIRALRQQFEEFGYSRVAMFIIGAAEIAGAGLLHHPEASPYAAMGLLMLMLGAIYSHIRVKHNATLMLPALLLAITLIVYLAMYYSQSAA